MDWPPADEDVDREARAARLTEAVFWQMARELFQAQSKLAVLEGRLSELERAVDGLRQEFSSLEGWTMNLSHHVQIKEDKK